MPAIYAHRAFGEDLKAILPRGRFQEIFEHADCFAVGLHGPDTLFYFHPLKKNAVSRHGEELHEARAADFFEGGARSSCSAVDGPRTAPISMGLYATSPWTASATPKLPCRCKGTAFRTRLWKRRLSGR